MAEAALDQAMLREAYDRASEALTRNKQHEEYCERRETRDEEFKREVRASMTRVEETITNGMATLHTRINVLVIGGLSSIVIILLGAIAWTVAKLAGWL